jgi:hypothetical protein
VIFSCFAISKATYGFVIGNMLACVRILWLPLALMFGLALAAGPRLLCAARALCAAGAGMTSAALVGGSLAMLIVVFALLASMVHAGLWRLMLLGAPVATPFYLRVGKDELRLLWLWLLQLFFFLALSLAVVLVTALLAVLLGHGSASAAVMVAGLVIMLLTIGWLATRLSLAGPATIDARHIALGASWRATRNRVARLREVQLVLAAPLQIALLVALVVFVTIGLPVSNARHLPLTSASYESAKTCARLLRELLYRLPILVFVLYVLALFLWSLLIAGRAIEYQTAKSASGP